VHRSIACSLRFLQNRKKEAPFRALSLPGSIDWLEADVMKGRALADAETRANMAGTFVFLALSCLETSRAHAMRIDGLCKELPTLTGDIKEDTTAMKAWRDKVRTKSKEWLGHVQIRSDMGAKLAAALFQKETQFMRNEVAKAPCLAPAKSIPLCSAPTVTHLFSDNEKDNGSGKSWGTDAAKMASAHQQKKKGAKYQKAGNPKGRPLPRQKRGGRKSRD
jgi:hypothetical protein